MKLLFSLEFQRIVIVVMSFLLLFQSSEAGASSQSQKDAQDGKKIAFCESEQCLIPVGHTLHIGLNRTDISEGSCASNSSKLSWNFTQHDKTFQIPLVLNGNSGFRSECFGRKHWLIKDNVTLSDSGTYGGFEIVQDKHNFEVQVVDVELQSHLSDDGTHVLIIMNYSDIATTGTTITNSNCWYNQTDSIQQFTRKPFWKAFIVNRKDKAFDRLQLCCQFSVSKDNSNETFSKIPDKALQIGQCNQTAVTIKPTTPGSHETAAPVVSASDSLSERIKSLTFPVVALLFLAFSFHQR